MPQKLKEYFINVETLFSILNSKEDVEINPISGFIGITIRKVDKNKLVEDHLQIQLKKVSVEKVEIG